MTFKTILFPVDFSDRCRGAARYVEALAGRFGSKVILLNVLENVAGRPTDLDFGGLVPPYPQEQLEERTRATLDTFLAEELKYVQVERRHETGDAARTIIRVAEAENVDLIMMPTQGYGAFRRFLLGSVTAKVLHDASCAVWTGVHMEDAPPLDAITIRSVLCANDLTEVGNAVFEAAVWFANEWGAKLIVTHAVPGSDAIPEKIMDSELRQQLIRDARLKIEAMCQQAGVEADTCIDAGDVHKVVAACAKAHKADIIIIGRGRRSGLGRLRAHSYAIIRESPCPVISI
jgi:nucleotide-binding universal stress UspA family protein